MIYGKYKQVRNASWQTLIDYKIDKLPVGLSEICRSAGIRVLNNNDVGESGLRIGESGVSIKQGSQWYIIYDPADSRQRIRFTIAHELGHIFLGHEMRYGYHTRQDNIIKPEAETEADMYAARLLAPACVLWALNIETPEDIARICDISITAASYRSERLVLLRSRGMFLKSPLERQVFEQFSDFIDNSNKL